MNNAAPSAAIAARRRQTEEKLAQVEAAISQLRRERGRLTVRAVAKRAAVNGSRASKPNSSNVISLEDGPTSQLWSVIR
ncbi:hypothetical protein [Streptomyces parvus]|uniref:hypothetical protein n=1 Tax=Streptomyces parvus TaxID=66428 RepID=UPI00380909E7